jgi:hypothetical protein
VKVLITGDQGPIDTLAALDTLLAQASRYLDGIDPAGVRIKARVTVGGRLRGLELTW